MNWIDSTDSPFKVFKNWLETTQASEQFEPTAMTLATLNSAGYPSARVVLLKDFDDKGFCFFTNYESEKGVELSEHPKGSLVFHWEKPLHRQIRIQGDIEKVSQEESTTYYNKRPRGSRIGAWASPQSQPIKDRQELEDLVAEMEKRFAGQDPPCPEHWGGYRLKPLRIEFWEAREFRLHDRMRFTRNAVDDPWYGQRLAP